jgi:hypothetical protein
LKVEVSRSILLELRTISNFRLIRITPAVNSAMVSVYLKVEVFRSILLKLRDISIFPLIRMIPRLNSVMVSVCFKVEVFRSISLRPRNISNFPRIKISRIVNSAVVSVYLKVEGKDASAFGSYAMRYDDAGGFDQGGNGLSSSAAKILTNDVLMDDSIASGVTKWYSFTANTGYSYSIEWMDRANYGAYYTDCDIQVSAYKGDMSPIFTDEDSDSSRSRISGYSGPVYLKVEGTGRYTSGSYFITYLEREVVTKPALATPFL